MRIVLGDVEIQEEKDIYSPQDAARATNLFDLNLPGDIGG